MAFMESLPDKVIQSIGQIKELYNRLVLLVAPAGKGKTSVLQEIKERINAPLINVNYELSKRLLELTERQRYLQTQKILDQIIKDAGREEILLDNNEILFDVHLNQDPLRILQGLSRNKTIVASWNGQINTENLFYAAPGHPEFRQYPLRDLTIIPIEGVNLTLSSQGAE